MKRPLTTFLTSFLVTLLLLIAVAVFVPPGPNAQNAEPEGKYESPWKTPWDYEGARGAEHWSELDPVYATCNSGREQSPIDIRNSQKVELAPLRFEYKSSPLNYVINNGHTIRVNYHDAPGSGNYLIEGERRYQLTQFHFHRPSEEHINGKTYDMAVHLMHQAEDGRVAGVAVLLKAGAANPVVQKVWEHMPKAEGQEKVPGVQIDPAALLPVSASYYKYAGSQTAPPCSEGVTWFVLKTPVEISAEQIKRFAELYPHDVRPIQPLNGRVVKESR